MRRKTRGTLTLAACAGLCLALVGAATSWGASGRFGWFGSAGPKAAATPPNVVLVLIDDLSANLVATMPNTTKLKHDGAYFPNAFVADSLCCTSRSAFLTGLYPHTNGVRTNRRGPDRNHPVGGWAAFHSHHDGKKTFVNAINKSADYRTAFQGKYLNQYQAKTGAPVPPGWTQWNAIVDGGYREWSYTMTTTVRKDGRYVMGKPRSYGSQHDKGDDAYATNVLSRRAVNYIEDSTGKKPYFLELAPYATHRTVHKGTPGPMFPAALADRPHGSSHGNCGLVEDCDTLRAGDLPGFNDPTADNRPQFDDGSRAPGWQSDTPLGKHARKLATRRLRDRARMAQAVDRMVGRIRGKLPPNSYLIVTSDNGFHLGQHRSALGKGTAYDSDIRVPLIVYKKAAHARGRLTPGPRPQAVSNIDLAPTIRELTGTPLADSRDGLSFVDALRHPESTKGPRYAFVEHTHAGAKGPNARQDPDLGKAKGGTSMVPSYIAVRSSDAVLIRYREKDRYAWEYYRYDRGAKNGTAETTNTYHRDMDTAAVRAMKSALTTFDGCRAATCRAARSVR